MTLDLNTLAGTSGEWLKGQGPDADIVISSRVRLARNAAQYPFVNRADEGTRSEIEQLLRERLDNAGRDFHYIPVDGLDSVDQQFLVERQLISRELADSEGSRGVAITSEENVSVMLNEEDHLRMQILRSGFSLEECWDDANDLDDALEGQVTYAFNDRLGYLTACPTNVGTGIRVSVMLHLPGLRVIKEIQKVFQALQKLSLAVRGLYGEGSQAMGDFYQISNQVTLGKSEAETIETVTGVVPKIIDYERKVREGLMKESRSKLHDEISRAHGILKSARTISSEETMHLLSSVRMGVNLGLIEGLPISTVNELFVHTQPAHLQKIRDKHLDSADRNAARASYLRERLAGSNG